MFIEHLVAKSFFGIFIIAGDFYLRTRPIVNFEWKKCEMESWIAPNLLLEY